MSESSMSERADTRAHDEAPGVERATHHGVLGYLTGLGFAIVLNRMQNELQGGFRVLLAVKAVYDSLADGAS